MSKGVELGMRRVVKYKKPKKTYDEVIKDITPNNIPREWTYDMTSTLPKVIGVYLEKYIIEAEQMVELSDEYRDEILDLIISFKNLEEDEWHDKSEEVFARLGKILPVLWW